MCHCFQTVENMSEKERAEVLEEHSEAELRSEYSNDELKQLGIAA
jgi:hypothetical protein